MPPPPTFAATLDRLDAATTRLRALAATHDVPAAPKPSFARAVLGVEVGQLLREAEPWELGLLARVAPEPGARAPLLDAAGAPALALGPAPVALATPLRRRARPAKDTDVEPEDYAHAGVNLLLRYEAIRPMPRARETLLGILDECAAERTEIAEIEARRLALRTDPADGGPDLAALIRDEEARLKTVQTEIARLTKRRDELLKKKRPAAATKPAPTFGAVPTLKPLPTTKPAPAPPSSAEAAFWDTPSPSARARPQFADEDLLADVSVAPPASPTPARKPVFDFARLAVVPRVADEDDEWADGDEPTVLLRRPPLSFEPPPRDEGAEEDEPAGGEPEAPPRAAPAPIASAPAAPAPAPTPKPAPAPEPEPEPEPPADAAPAEIVIDEDVSRILAKMWASMGESILPGRAASPLSDADTITHLEAPDAAPAAQLVLALLRAPGRALPHERLKAAVGAKALHAAVAKRLVRVERGRGEQTVKFAV